MLCDGCGQPAMPEHIAERVRRLELATRYRPIHIQVLFLADAPPSGVENDFYNTASAEGSGGQVPRNWTGTFFEALDICPGAGNRVEECLAEFQRRGYFLAFASECPLHRNVKREPKGIPSPPTVASLMTQLASLVVKRIQFSYKPRFIVPLSRNTQPLVRVLEEAGLENVLVGSNGSVADWPLASDPSTALKESATLRSLLTEIQNRTKAG